MRGSPRTGQIKIASERWVERQATPNEPPAPADPIPPLGLRLLSNVRLKLTADLRNGAALRAALYLTRLQLSAERVRRVQASL